MHGRLTCVCSLNPPRRLSSGKRQQTLLLYTRWKRSRARKKPRKTPGTMFSMCAKPFAQPVEEGAVSHRSNPPGEAKRRVNQDADLEDSNTFNVLEDTCFITLW